SNDPDESVVNVEVSLTVGAGFIVGDVNGDGEVDYTDLIYLANYLFASGPPPQPMASGDVNGDGDVSYTDLVMLANILYGKGMPLIPHTGKVRGESR
ncbi:MAG: dockerin type I repeat-containing protein, partial [Candidatus Hydrothermae bacterium]|nr:dockerin type I repeat-containing protein [Candidatus Hydrothermae bacterium]